MMVKLIGPAAAAVLLAGCSSTQAPPVQTVTITQPAAPATSTTAPSSSPTGVDTRQEGVGPVSTPTSTIDQLKRVPLGTQLQNGSDGLTVTKVTCGLHTIPGAVTNPAPYNPKNPQYIDAVAPSGKSFCRVDAKWTNIGKAPASRRDFGDLLAGDYRYSSNDVATISYILNHNEPNPVNPGDTFAVSKVYLVVEGTKATGVLWPSDTINSGASVVFNAQ